MKHIKPAGSLGLGYLGIFFIYCVFGICIITIDPSASLLVGLIGIVITLPWSLVFSPILDMIGYIVWYDQFVNKPMLYGVLAMLGLLPAALMNAVLLYLIRSKIRR